MRPLGEIRYFLLDIDGVLYRGKLRLPGAKELLRKMEARNLRYMLITNNATRTREGWVARLAEMGISVDREHILTSSIATAEYLTSILPAGASLYVIGEKGLYSSLQEAGFRFAKEGVAAVVVGLDRDLTFTKLREATLAIRAGALFIGTNPDKTFPAEDGIVPGAGAILASLEASTGVRPTVIGKPEPILLQMALEKMKAQARDTALIGDRLDTDVLAGRRLGLTTILVLTGVTVKEDLKHSEVQPDYTFDSLAQLVEALS